MMEISQYKEINRVAYNSLAKEYEERVNNDYLKDQVLLEPFFNYLDNTFNGKVNVLDVGCGNGLNLRMFTEHNFSSVGIDISEEMANIAQKVSPRSNVITGDFLTTDLLIQQFEGILSKASIHLFTKQDAMEALGKMHSLLAPRGMLFIATTVTDISSEGFHQKHDYKNKIIRFRKFWTPTELEEAIINTGFKILKQFTNHERDWDKHWFNILATK